MSQEYPVRRLVLRALPCALIVAFPVDAALAQSATAETLDSVVVTARKRPERALDVPLSISVVDGEEIKDRGAYRLSEIPIPNVSFVGAENNALTNFSVRGVQSQNRSNIGFDSGIGVYVDGVYMGRSAAFNQETFDTQRVEFLRGPQGTLFGKNSIAGALSVTTLDPTAKLTASGRADFGSDHLRRYSAYAATALGSDALLGSIGIYSGKRDGYVHNLAGNRYDGNEDVLSFRTKLLILPAPGLRITLAADYLKDKSVAPSSTILSGYGFLPNNDPLTSNTDTPTLANRTIKGTSATITYDLGRGLALTSITAVRKLESTRSSDTDAGPLPIVTGRATANQTQWSQELRIGTTERQRIEYVAGLYYYQQQASGSAMSTFGPSAPVLASIRNTTGNTFGDIDTKSYSAFGNADFNVTDALTFTGGLRVTRERKDLAYQQVVTFPAFLASSLPLERDSFQSSNVSPLLSARYKLARDSMVYATFSKGFRSGGWNVDNITAGGPTSFKQTRFGDEKLNNYEIGAKTALMDGRVTLSADLFRMDYRNVQVTQLVSVLGGGGALVGLVTNGGKARIQGGELEIAVRPMAGLRLSAGYGYADARYKDYIDRSGAIALNFNGNKLNFAPKSNANATASYTTYGDYGSATFRLDYAYTNSYFIGRENTAAQRIPGFELWNARVSFAGPGEHWQVDLYCNNLLDTRYIVSQGSAGFAAPIGAGTNQIVTYGRPRTLGVVGTYTF